jgi:uroporphyrin-III C-methyltransferase
MAPGDHSSVCEELAWRAAQDQLTIINFESDTTPASVDERNDGLALASYLDSHLSVRLVFVTDTLLSRLGGGSGSTPRHSCASVEQLYTVCRGRRVPVNITDMPDLCDFTLPSAHRMPGTPLQLAVTTNDQGCCLGARIRRELVTRLPCDAGTAVVRVGELRRLAHAEGATDDKHHATTPNQPVPQRSLKGEETDAE